MKLTIIFALSVMTTVAFSAGAEEIRPPGQRDWVSSKKYIQVNDRITLAYVEWGKPAGDPVVLIHGFSDTSRAYSTIAPYLHGKRFLAVDLRGHGDSTEPECCYYVSDFAEDISDFITALGYDKATVVGHSLGSLTAGVLASVHYDQVNRLVLISSALKSGPEREALYDTLHSQSFPMDINGEFIKQWAANSGSMDEEMLTYLRQEEVAMPKRAWLGVVKGLEILDWTPASRRISAPTLIIWGAKDEFMVEDEQIALRQALPHAEFIRYDDLGHSMYWEDPRRCAKDLLNFLR